MPSRLLLQRRLVRSVEVSVQLLFERQRLRLLQLLRSGGWLFMWPVLRWDVLRRLGRGLHRPLLRGMEVVWQFRTMPGRHLQHRRLKLCRMHVRPGVLVDHGGLSRLQRHSRLLRAVPARLCMRRCQQCPGSMCVQ